MNQQRSQTTQLDCAMIFRLAAQAHKAEGNLVQAIELYKRACEVYVRCNQHTAPPVGLVYIEIAGCLTELGDDAESEIFFSKAREIMCSNAPVIFKSVYTGVVAPETASAMRAFPVVEHLDI